MINKNKIWIFFVGALILVPYVETASFKRYDIIINENSHLPAICIVLMVMSLLVTCLTRKLTPIVFYIKQQRLTLLIVFLEVQFVFSTIYYGEINILPFWFIIPIYVALTVLRFIDTKQLPIKSIARSVTFIYALYLLVCISWNVLFLGFKISSGTYSYRLYSTGGGTLTLAYMAVIFAFFVYLKKEWFSNTERNLLLLLYTVIALVTASRLSFWMIICLASLILLKDKRSVQKVVILLSVAVALIVADPIKIIYSYAPRLMNLNVSESERFVTWGNAVSIFNDGNIIQMLFGRGFGHFFPYQHWLKNYDLANRYSKTFNLFSYNGKLLLVQPHNITIYFLLEGGLVGTLLLVLYWIRIFIKSSKMKNLREMLFLIAVVVVTQYDSLLIVQPGAAFIVWLLVFISSENQKCSGEINE